MNPELKKYLDSLNIRVVNPMWDSIARKEVIGWHCVGTSQLRQNTHIEKVTEYLANSNLDYYLVDPRDTSLSFYIFK